MKTLEINDTPAHLHNLRSYVDKYTLWQALGGTSISAHLGTFDSTILFHLVCDGKVVASLKRRFTSIRKAKIAFEQLREKRIFEAGPDSRLVAN